MNRFFKSPKFLVAAALATAAIGAASVAEARPNVVVSVGFQSGPGYFEPAQVYVEPRPVYVQPRPLYVQPAPVYVRAPAFVPPHHVFEGPRWGDDDWRVEREREWRRAEWRRHESREHFGDRDHGRDDRKRHHDYRD